MKRYLSIAAFLLLSPAVYAASDEVAQHKTHAEIRDITDPANPRTLWEGDNVIGECGVRNLMAYMLGLSSMGAAEGAANTLGTVCAGTTSSGAQKDACPYSAGGTLIRIGRGSAASCTATGNPWPCCTGTGTGCTADKTDVILFAEGQPNQSLTGVETNWRAWRTAGQGNVFTLGMDAGYPRFYWDGTTTQGIQFAGTSAGAAEVWCEFGVRSVTSGGGCGPIDSGTTPFLAYPGWQLNHAIINPCLSKLSTETWQLIVTITFT